MMMNAFTLYRSTLVAAATASLMLVACGRSEDGIMAGVKMDESLAEQKTETVAAKADSALQDATITATVKTELAQDSVLGAATLNVRTEHGLVEIKGSAPDAAARDRATRIALAVAGVLSVENRLTIAAPSA